MKENTEFRKAPHEQLSPENQVLETTETGPVKGLKDKFRRFFPKEQKQGSHLPEISIDIFYSYHSTKEDLDGLGKRFEEADVFIPEAPGWSPGVLKMFRKASSGEVKLLDILEFSKRNDFPDAQMEIFSIVFSSSKPIGIIDVSFASPIHWKGMFIKDNYKLKRDFPRTLASIRRLMEKQARNINARERHMLSQLKPTVQNLLKTYPEVKDKPTIKVLLQLGVLHTFVYHTLKKDNPKVTRTINPMPFVYGFSAEAVRSFIFGKEISDELLSKVYLEGIFSDVVEKRQNGMWLFRITRRDRYKENMFIRRLVSYFSFEEAQEVFERFKQGEDEEKLFEVKFAEKGVRLPQTEKELDEFLAKPLSRRDTMHE